jgi:hypothetical protein
MFGRCHSIGSSVRRELGSASPRATSTHCNVDSLKVLDPERPIREADIGPHAGQNIKIEYRWAEGHYDRLPALAAELAQRRLSAMVTTGSGHAALAANAATNKIPIIFSTGDDPLESGIVSNLNRPNRNVTGATFLTSVLEAKRLELLHESRNSNNTTRSSNKKSALRSKP